MKYMVRIDVSNISEEFYDALIDEIDDVCRKHDAKCFVGIGEEDFDAEDEES